MNNFEFDIVLGLDKHLSKIVYIKFNKHIIDGMVLQADLHLGGGGGGGGGGSNRKRMEVLLQNFCFDPCERGCGSSFPQPLKGTWKSACRIGNACTLQLNKKKPIQFRHCCDQQITSAHTQMECFPSITDKEKSTMLKYYTPFNVRGNI